MAGVSTGVSLLGCGYSLKTNTLLWLEGDASPMINKVNSAQILTLDSSFESLSSSAPIGSLGSYLVTSTSSSSDKYDSMNWATSPIFYSGGDFSVSVWMNWTSNSFIGSGHSALFDGNVFEIRRQGNTIWLYSSSYSDTHTPTSMSITGSSGTWGLVTFTGTKTGANLYTIKCYLNTTLVTTQTSISLDSSGTYKIISVAGIYANATSQTNSPTTYYDNISYFNKSLDSTDIGMLYNAGSGITFAQLP
jgi:hypothetical protein